jgi:hypothetical protein
MDCDIKQRSEVTRLTKTIQHRELDNAIRDIADLIGCVGFLSTQFDDISFLDLKDTPLDYTGLAGYQAVVNGTEDGIEFIAPGGGADGNTWDVTGAAFVDPVNGDNVTGVVGDGNKPYATVAVALLFSDFVILKPGTYTAIILINTDNKHIHCMEGVDIANNGVYVAGLVTNNFKFTGRAVFSGASSYLLRLVNTNAVVEFECAHATDCNRICFVEGSTAFAPKARISADYIRCNCFNGGAYATRLQGEADLEFNIKYYVESQHDIWHTRNCYGAARLVINCPESRVIDNYGFNYGNVARRALRVSDFSADLQCVVNGDLISTYSSTVNEMGVVDFQNLANPTNFPFVTVNGNIISDNQTAINSRFNSRYGEFNFNGDIICKSNVAGWASSPLFTQLTGTVQPSDQKFRFNGGYIQGATRIVVGMGTFVYMKDCAYYNSDVGGGESAFFLENSGSTNQELYLYNTMVETDDTGVTPELVAGNSVGATVFTVGSNGNVVIGATYADGWAQYAQIAGLIVPKF